jgi:hypothetical protein
MWSCNYIVCDRDYSSHTVNWRMCAVLSPSLQYNARWIVDISPIAAELLLVGYWSLNMRSCKHIVYVRENSTHCVSWRLCAVLAPSLQYKAHRIVEISPISAQTRSVEYWCLNMRKCNYIVYGRDNTPDSVSWRISAVFGTMFVS